MTHLHVCLPPHGPLTPSRERSAVRQPLPQQRRRPRMGSPYAWVQERVNQDRQGGNPDTRDGSGTDGCSGTFPLDVAFPKC